MEEFRLDPVDLTFDLISNERTGCRECLPVENAIKSIEFKGRYLRVYEIKDRVQPSRYQLDGKFFKRSNAHGYEELIVENEKHSADFVTYSADDIEKLLLVVSERLNELKTYDIGKNISVSRYVNGHDYWDLVILPIPMHNTQKCHVCESLNYVGNREIYKTENLIAYVPFSPKKNEVARITTLKHTAIEELDSVVAFDLANLIIKIINKFTNEITFNIKQSGADHFELDVLAGENEYNNVITNMALISMCSVENVTNCSKAYEQLYNFINESMTPMQIKQMFNLSYSQVKSYYADIVNSGFQNYSIVDPLKYDLKLFNESTNISDMIKTILNMKQMTVNIVFNGNGKILNYENETGIYSPFQFQVYRLINASQCSYSKIFNIVVNPNYFSSQSYSYLYKSLGNYTNICIVNSKNSCNSSEMKNLNMSFYAN